jgi:hypothetical protein
MLLCVANNQTQAADSSAMEAVIWHIIDFASLTLNHTSVIVIDMVSVMPTQVLWPAQRSLPQPSPGPTETQRVCSQHLDSLECLGLVSCFRLQDPGPRPVFLVGGLVRGTSPLLPGHGDPGWGRLSFSSRTCCCRRQTLFCG